MRQSEDFVENFSIGMIYQPGEEPGSFDLIRCNGQHGGERAHSHHALFHVHRARADDINAGILEARDIQQAENYASFREALAFFCRLIDMPTPDAYFPGITQIRLFEAGDL
jgi:hypothetical protein